MAPNDEVERCGTTRDCSPTGDNRYEAICVFPEGSDLDGTEVDKVCVASVRSLSCNPMAGMPQDHPLTMTFEQLGGLSRYACAAEQFGSLGCPQQPSGGCEAGLEPNADGICDDTDPNTPPAVYVTSQELAGRDVLDQYCRSFFCDDEFVCDDSFTCVRCDPELPYGEGGCGEVYANGARSCVYLGGADLESVCDGPDADADAPKFGACEA